MQIEFRFGPKDGERLFLPIGRLSDTIIVQVGEADYLYRKTPRLTDTGYCIYQFVSVVHDVPAVA